MKAMSINAQVNANAGSGYKCSACGQKFYTYKLEKAAWWLPAVKVRAIDQCNTHIICCHNGKAKAKWCW